MSGFTPEWLSLREQVDCRSRNATLLVALRKRFASAGRTTVCELGAGAGSLLRALAPLLAERQEWRLIDADPDNLAAATSSLSAWADRAERAGEDLHLQAGGKEIVVRFEQRDLSDETDGLLEGADLVAASALFDLAGPAWIGRLARALASKRTCFYTSLTYSGGFQAHPPQPLDRAVTLAFGAHQRVDKGLGGVAAGPTAHDLLAAALRAEGAEVQDGESDWHLTREDSGLIDRMVGDYAAVALETDFLPAASIEAWRQTHLANCKQLSIGHRDLFASWPEAA